MTSTEIEKIFSQFPLQNVLVIGDVMVDSYVLGKVERMSPEAPVPVINVDKKENRLGGAANVALNLIALKAHPIICTVIGNDRMGEEFKKMLNEKGMKEEGIISSSDRRTTVKTRIISQHQHLLRMDEEETDDLSKEDEGKLISKINSILEMKYISVVIFEDYNKGVLTPTIIEKTIAICKQKGIPTCVDPKIENFLLYKGVTLFKPNLKELKDGLKLEVSVDDNLHQAANKLHEILQLEISLITLSEHGVFVKNGNAAEIFPAYPREITDVSGAGDTVIAVAALCVALKCDHRFIAQLSNLAGGLVCEHTGVVPIGYDELISESKNKLSTN